MFFLERWFKVCRSDTNFINKRDPVEQEQSHGYSAYSDEGQAAD